MKHKLEDFIKKNKDAFDDHEPSAALWKRLEKKMQPVEETVPAKVVKINWWKWVAAAMIIITAGVLSRPYWQKNNLSETTRGIAEAPKKDSNLMAFTQEDVDTQSTQLPLKQDTDVAEAKPDNRDLKKTNPDPIIESPAETVKEELFHYTRLIEIKQKEISGLKKNHPELFEKFSEDLTALDKSYSALKSKYDEGLNSEQLLSAMIENLKLQTALLNRQLEITKKVKKQNNSTNNEKAYKNI